MADMYDDKERGVPMSIFTICTLEGGAIYPLIFGFVVEKLDEGYRWIQYIQLIVAFVWFFTIIAMGETRPSAILTKKAKQLRKNTGDNRYIAASELGTPRLGKIFKKSSTKAIYLMVTEPIIISFCLWIGFAWMVFINFFNSLRKLINITDIL